MCCASLVGSIGSGLFGRVSSIPRELLLLLRFCMSLRVYVSVKQRERERERAREVVRYIAVFLCSLGAIRAGKKMEESRGGNLCKRMKWFL